jgi:hypothetical protein
MVQQVQEHAGQGVVAAQVVVLQEQIQKVVLAVLVDYMVAVVVAVAVDLFLTQVQVLAHKALL